MHSSDTVFNNYVSCLPNAPSKSANPGYGASIRKHITSASKSMFGKSRIKAGLSLMIAYRTVFLPVILTLWVNIFLRKETQVRSSVKYTYK